MSFSSHSVFSFDLYPTAAPQFGAMSTDSSGDFLFNLVAPLTMSVDAPVKSGLEHYVNIVTSVSGPATLAVHDGVLLLKENSKNLDISVQWDQTYVQTYQPDKSTWGSIIAGYVKSYLAKTGISFTLPVMESAGAFSMSIENAVVDGSSVNVQLGISSLAK
jgi:hypothetical protein